MAESGQAPTAHEERLEQLGAAESARARRDAGLARGREKIGKAIALYESMGEGADITAATLQICQAAWPKALKNLVSMATGEKKGCPAAVQREAIKMVAGAMGMAFEVAPGSSSNKPLAEMSLGELETLLIGLASRARDMQAIEGQGERLPHSGSNGQEEPGADGAGQAGVGAHPPVGGSEGSG